MSSRSRYAGSRSTMETSQGCLTYYRLSFLEERGLLCLDHLPFSIRILVECVLRNVDGHLVKDQDVTNAASWSATALPRRNIPFMPARVVLQDFTGVPAVVDLAAMRAALVRIGRDPQRINPVVSADLVIDHSVQVDYFGTSSSFARNVEREFQRNGERYSLLRWAQQTFQNFRVVPPGTGIVHQVNLEYLASVVVTRQGEGGVTAFSDTLVGTDSHTTMINGLGVLGWGVGGIEAEAVLLGQPYYMLLPEVVGFKLTGYLQEGVAATDLVLTITEMLRRKGVVNKFVEFYGHGLSNLPVADRATIANMAPEYGATVGFFPIDDETLRYLRSTGRDPVQVDMVEQYTKAQGLFRTDATPDPNYSDTVALDMGTVEPSLAGPRRPQDRVSLHDVGRSFYAAFQKELDGANLQAKDGSLRCLGGEGGRPLPQRRAVAVHGLGKADLDEEKMVLAHGAVVIAAITSCTNTSNPMAMVGAGLLARNAVGRELSAKPWVKTSMAPGSRVVTDYLNESGLTRYLEALGFYTVGYGCTTCIGNSGPLSEPVARAVTDNNLVVASVLSGNRNFEGRIHSEVKANYLASPMLVVAYALAGRVDMDIATEPLGYDSDGHPVYLRDIWPSQQSIQDAVVQALKPEMFRDRYAEVFHGDEQWRDLSVPQGNLYEWNPISTYIQEPPFFQDFSLDVPPLEDVGGARVLALLGDSITTDHISPAGSISAKSPAGQYLIEQGVQQADFNTYGARRGNHQVMMRGTFGNVRLRNQLVPDTEGDWTVHLPSGERMSIYDAACRYQQDGVPLLIIGGKEYGTGSSRDWAAKGCSLLGVRVVLAESFERIHRSNLVGMGVLPLQFKPGENAQVLGLIGRETFDITGIAQGLKPGREVSVQVRRDDGQEVVFKAIARIDMPVELDYYQNGGVLQMVLRRIMQEEKSGE